MAIFWSVKFYLCTNHELNLLAPSFLIFASLARANERARVQNVRDFPQTKLDSEINARFLLNEHGDPHFLFYKFNENNILNNWEKKLAETYGYFFGKWNKCYR